MMTLSKVTSPTEDNASSRSRELNLPESDLLTVATPSLQPDGNDSSEQPSKEPTIRVWQLDSQDQCAMSKSGVLVAAVVPLDKITIPPQRGPNADKLGDSCASLFDNPWKQVLPKGPKVDLLPHDAYSFLLCYGLSGHWKSIGCAMVVVCIQILSLAFLLSDAIGLSNKGNPFGVPDHASWEVKLS